MTPKLLPLKIYQFINPLKNILPHLEMMVSYLNYNQNTPICNMQSNDYLKEYFLRLWTVCLVSCDSGEKGKVRFLKEAENTEHRLKGGEGGGGSTEWRDQQVHNP